MKALSSRDELYEQATTEFGRALGRLARAYEPDVDRVKELHRETRTFVVLEQAWKDVRYGVSGLLKSPGFTLFAVLALALGVGVNTTVFNAYNAIALKPIPVAGAGSVVRLKRSFESHGLGIRRLQFSYDEYSYCRDHNSGVFSDLVAANGFAVPVVLPPTAVANSGGRHFAQLVSANFFTGLGIIPRLGRAFLPGEDAVPGGNPVAILSDGFWKRTFVGGAQILGQTIKINGTTFTVIGVTPAEFTGTGVSMQVPDLWVPVSMYSQLIPDRKWDPGEQQFELIARLSGLGTFTQAQAETDGLIRQYDSTLHETERTDRTTIVTLEHAVWFDQTDDIRFTILAAGFMLLIGMILLTACANIANMLLARGATRQREIGVRMALGAGRGRIVRQLLTESCLLSALGGCIGLVFAIWASRLLDLKLQQLAGQFGASGLQLNLSPDLRVFAYALVLTVIVGFLCGLSPALQFSKPDLSAAFKEEGSSLSRRLRRSRLSGTLVAVQVAVSMFLLVSTGLLVRGLIRARGADPGFETRHAFAFQADFAAAALDRRRDAAVIAARQRRLVDVLASVPGVQETAMGSLPFGTWTPPIILGDATSEAAQKYRPYQSQRTLASFASETYLDVLRIPILRGRNFTHQDVAGRGHVAIVSAAGARLFWPDEDALGKHFQLDMDWRGHLVDFEVVGIAKDVRFANLSRLDPSHFYLPAEDGATAGGFPAPMSILFRIPADSPPIMEARSAVSAVEKDLASSVSLVSLADLGMSRDRLTTEWLALFAGILSFLAVALAGTGIYGVMSYLVTQRTREIGVRISLGATSFDVLKSVILQGLFPVFVGIGTGLLLAAGFSTIAHLTLSFPGSVDFLYGVPFYDPVTFLGLSCFVLGLAALASVVPASGALRVDPVVALRHG